MAIETQPEKAHEPGGREPGGPRPARPWWLRPAIHTAIIGAVLGYLLGHWLGNVIAAGYQQVHEGDLNDLAIVLGYAFGTVGWLAGLGVFNDLLVQMTGRDAPARELQDAEPSGLARYFRYSLDHKVVGIQYLVGMIIYFCTAGLFAMAIRAELLSPTYHLFNAGTYIEIVGEHGTMMMMLMTSVILGPFGNYLVPIMIGSKRVAFPRIEALSFWLTPCAFLILLSGLLMGGFPFGWTGYAPLSIQATEGADSYAVAFGLMGISIILAGFNIIATVICCRAPGMRWSRLPMFVWSMVATSFLMVLAAPVLVGGMYMMLTDRTAQTAFFVPDHGGSSYLYQNLFWFFGHPEVYILALPGFGIVLEILPVMCRKPLFAYKVACAGMIGVTLLSFFVWQHHLFDSGINPDMRPLFMLTTELISIPTGFIYLVALGTFWKARFKFTVPMLFALGMLFNFLIGGISGVFLSDVPGRHHRARQLLRDGALPLHDHGRADLRVHGRPVLLAAEDDGHQAEPDARQVAVLDHVHLLQLHVPAAVRGRHGRPAAPGVRVRAEPADPERLGLDLLVLPRRVHPALRDQLRLVDGVRAGARGGQPVALARPGVAGRLAAAAGQLRARPRGAVRTVPVRLQGRAAGR